jgi:hypothetical protein
MRALLTSILINLSRPYQIRQTMVTTRSKISVAVGAIKEDLGVSGVPPVDPILKRKSSSSKASSTIEKKKKSSDKAIKNVKLDDNSYISHIEPDDSVKLLSNQLPVTDHNLATNGKIILFSLCEDNIGYDKDKVD